MADRRPMADISTESPAFKAAKEKWALTIVLMAGTDALRAEAGKWLPQFEGEATADWERRVDNTTLTNVYKKTVSRLASTPFAEPITFDPDLDDRIGGADGAGGWIRNVDRAGTDVTAFAKECLKDLVQFGKCHIYIDHPPVGQEITQAQQKAFDIRPFFKRVSPKDLFFWDVNGTSGSEVVTELRWHETVTERVGKYEQEEFRQIRVVKPGLVEIWRRTKDGKAKGKDWIQVGAHEVIMPGDDQRIPFVTIYANRTGDLTSEPPLDDLAQLNLKHAKGDSDLQRIIHVACTPFMLAKGFTPQELEDTVISPNMIVTTSAAEADMKYVEHSGSQIAVIQENQRTIMSDMEAMSLQMLSKNASPTVTATEKVVTTAEQTSELQEIVRQLESGLTRAFQVALMWVGETDVEDVVIGTNINTDFGLIFRVDNDLLNLGQMFTGNAITHETYLKEAQARGLLDEGLDVIEEAKLAKKEASDQATQFTTAFEPRIDDDDDGE